MANRSLTRAADHNEFFYLNLELGGFSEDLINFPWTMQVIFFFCLSDTNQAIQFSGSQNGTQEKLIRFPLTSLSCGWATAG